MLGAIIGDMAGSRHEGRRGKVDRYDFPLFEEGAHMTDDSILSMAVMDGAVRGLNDAKTSRVEIAKSIKLYARTHAHQGYGGRFREWFCGDTDTNAAIVGGIAEAFRGIPSDIVDAAHRVIDRDWTHGLRPEVERRVAALHYIRSARRYEQPPEDRYDKGKMLGGA